MNNSMIAEGGLQHGAIPWADLNSGNYTVLYDLLFNYQSYSTSRPKAFLNWIIVDEEFKKVNSSFHMGAVQVPLIDASTEVAKPMTGPENMTVRRNGWLYVYLSNESNQDVYFDDLVINHKRGPVVEQTNYYPFGLEIPGLHSQALGFGGSENRYNYNGKELQAREFTDGTGLTWNDYGARMYDPQIGRWMVVDPMADNMRRHSPYNYAFNNPVGFVDPDGMESISTQNGVQTLAEWMADKEAEDANRNDPNRWDRNGDKQSQSGDKDLMRAGDNRGVREGENTRRRWRERNRRRGTNGSLFFDERGRELLGRWLNGSRQDLYTKNGVWGEYMKNNELLTKQIFAFLKEDASSRTTSGDIDLTVHVDIENGYTTGYEMLHGTNFFNIKGTVAYDNGQALYNLSLTWNDVIDKNKKYQDDIKLSNILHLFYTPADYSVHISWNEVYKIVFKK